MDCFVGIDLGSTTTKSIYMSPDEEILGRGITNSRSNYALACEVAADEAEINSRFNVLRGRLESAAGDGSADEMAAWLTARFRLAQHLLQTDALEEECRRVVSQWPDAAARAEYEAALERIFAGMRDAARASFVPGARTRSDFFRDLAASEYLERAEVLSRESGLSFDRLTGVFDRAILAVEGRNFASRFRECLEFARDETLAREEFASWAGAIRQATEEAATLEFNVINTIGTGYGRQTLPFARHQIRSEILCHGLGAHFMFPDTRTVLDIGGQDTKAIQVDDKGIVTNFQMNDRCAAGCGRYLGYIADEMSMGVHELGPLALRARKNIRINSTCTVFAGAELRERLAVGERREDILAGLHRAMILRAMSLLARSGGVRNAFTFTGGVARNPAAVQALERLVEENYGERTIHISPDSIFTGALGAALFAHRDQRGDLVNVDLATLKKAVN